MAEYLALSGRAPSGATLGATSAACLCASPDTVSRFKDVGKHHDMSQGFYDVFFGGCSYVSLEE